MTLTDFSLLTPPEASSLPPLLRLHAGEVEAYAALAPLGADELGAALADLGPMLVGREPLERGALWERMAREVEWYEEPDQATAAVLSGLDLGLWQLAAQEVGLPLYALLGGRYFPRVDTYEWFRAEHRQAQNAPAGGVLLEAEEDVGATVTEAEGLRRRWGDQGRLLVALGGWASAKEAPALAQRLQAAEVFWALDLLPPEAADYRALGKEVELPLGAGGLLTGLRPFRELLRGRAVDLLAADLRLCGGITGAQQVATLAAAEGLPVAVLAGDGALNQLLAAQLASTSETFLPVARPDPGALSEVDFSVEDGFLALGSKAGVGGTLPAETLEGYGEWAG